MSVAGEAERERDSPGWARRESYLSNEVKYETTLENVARQQIKSTLAADCFDNGRTARQLRESFKNSYATVIAYADERIIGTARVLSDGFATLTLSMSGP